MKIFISWSGDRSHALASAVCEWLRPILHFAEPWLSSSDIQSGDRWGTEVAKNLQDTNFGILCVTSDNLNAPWLLFEAGALAKSIDDGRVIPLLLDLEKSDLSGPLTQFQAEKTDRAGIKKLAESLNKAAPSAISQETLGTLFDALWPNLEEKIASVPASTSPQKKIRPQSEVLEELVAGVRSVEMRVRDAIEDGPDFRSRRRRRYHPEMMMEMRHRFLENPGDPLQLLIVAGFIREDFPWFYEIAAEAYKAVRSGDSLESTAAVRRLRHVTNMLVHGPYLDMLGADKMTHMILREAIEMVSDYEAEQPKIATKPKRKAPL